MNVLSQQKRALIVQLLCEGNSMRGIVRLTGVCRQTISTLILDLGAACEWYMDWKHRGLECKRVQVDEVWSFLKQKEQRLEEKGQVDRGDIWSFLSFDPDSKLLISIMTGKRTAEMASRFMEDLERRVTGRFHLTTDQFRSYKDAVKDGFRHRNMDYSQVLKLMAAGGQSRGESAQIIGNGEGKPRVSGKPWRRPYVAGVEVRDVLGEPDMARSSTAGVERVNLTLRMSNRRFARSTNAHSKSLPHHVAMLAIFGVHYNYVRRHASLSKTPAQEAGLSAKRWTMLDLVSIMNLASAQDTAEVRRLDPSEGNL